MVCKNCNGPVTKDDIKVYRLSSMSAPWCQMCVKEENKRILEEEHVPGTQARYRALPRYLQETS